MQQQQQEPNGLNPAQRELEAALRTLAPSPASMDAVAAAFTAGRNSSRRQTRAWRAVAILLLAAGSTAAWLLPHRPGGPAAPRNAGNGSMLVVVQSQPSSASAPAPPPQSLLMLQRTLLQDGVDGLPATQLPATDGPQPKDTL